MHYHFYKVAKTARSYDKCFEQCSIFLFQVSELQEGTKRILQISQEKFNADGKTKEGIVT
jgi:hypothetical protein